MRYSFEIYRKSDKYWLWRQRVTLILSLPRYNQLSASAFSLFLSLSSHYFLFSLRQQCLPFQVQITCQWHHSIVTVDRKAICLRRQSRRNSKVWQNLILPPPPPLRRLPSSRKMWRMVWTGTVEMYFESFLHFESWLQYWRKLKWMS